MSDDRPAVYEENGRVIYRASALGGCPRMLSALRMGYEPTPPPPEIQRVFDEGHLHEDSMCEWVESRFGWELVREVEVEFPVSSSVIVRGHIDADIVGEDLYLENKSQSKDEFERYKSDWSTGWFPHYKWSQSVYMAATGKGCLLVRKNRNNGEFKWESFYVPWYTEAQIRAKVLSIEGAARRGELLEECSQDYGCPVHYLHNVREQAESAVGDEELDMLMRQYKKAVSDEKIAKGIKEESRKAIRGAITGNSYQTVSGSRVTFYMQGNPPTLDLEKMEKDGIELDKYRTQTKSERMRVMLKENEDGA